ncbi:DUF6538 domain-containing protein [Roseibium sp.]|uniref:DUF6538 domain-containing protein n=1 Tax=Roseibium sp. TaxID=1936156 RepID=UPI003A969402
MRDPANKNLKQRPNGFWHFQRMKPTDLRERLGGGKFIQIALKTDSLIEARRKRDVINARLDAEWAALRGNPADYLRELDLLPTRKAVEGLPTDPTMRAVLVDAARQDFHRIFDVDEATLRSCVRGTAEESAAAFMALPEVQAKMAEYTAKPHTRAANAFAYEGAQAALLSNAGFNDDEIKQAIKAVAGELKGEDGLKVSKAIETFLEEIAIEVTSKHSPSQKKNYENQKRRSAQRFIDVVGDVPLLDITREQAVKFRDWWKIRIYQGDETGKRYSAGAGIKELGDMRQIWGSIAERQGHFERNPFDRLTFKEEKRRKLPYDRQWISGRWLTSDALSSMNDELRWILLMLIETGARPSEILRMPLDRIRVGAAIPHILVDDIDDDDDSARGTVKTDFSVREIPLVGVALPAAKALVNAGGVQRYWDKSDSFSAAANKFLRDNGLQQEKRTLGGLRHAVVEALKNDAAVGDDLRRAITGHKGNSSHEENYGRFSLERKLEPLKRIALPFDPAII